MLVVLLGLCSREEIPAINTDHLAKITFWETDPENFVNNATLHSEGVMKVHVQLSTIEDFAQKFERVKCGDRKWHDCEQRIPLRGPP